MPFTERAERWSRRLRVSFWRRSEPDRVFVGYTTNISSSGAFVTTRTPIGRNGRIRIEFAGEEDSFVLEAIVARAQAAPEEMQHLVEGGMGVRFLSVHELIAETVPSANGSPRPMEPRPSTPPAQAGPQRPQEASAPAPVTTAAPAGSVPPVADTGSPAPAPPAAPPPSAPTAERIPATAPRAATRRVGGVLLPVFPVRFKNFEQFKQLFDRDIRAGGLFVSTESPADVDEEVLLVIELPDSGDSVELHAKVVHVVAPERVAGSSNLLSGMGVQFVDAGEPLERLAEFARR